MNIHRLNYSLLLRLSFHQLVLAQMFVVLSVYDRSTSFTADGIYDSNNGFYYFVFVFVFVQIVGLKVNSRKMLQSLINSYGISDDEQFTKVRRLGN